MVRQVVTRDSTSDFLARALNPNGSKNCCTCHNLLAMYRQPRCSVGQPRAVDGSLRRHFRHS